MKIHCIDSHTGGEPTRIVIDGGHRSVKGPWRSAWKVFARSSTTFAQPL